MVVVVVDDDGMMCQYKDGNVVINDESTTKN